MAKHKTKGLKVKIGASSGSASLLAQTGDCTINFGDREAALDVSSHDTATNSVEKMDNGFKDTFSLEGEIFWDPANSQHDFIIEAQADGDSVYVEVEIGNTGAKASTTCRVTKFTVPVPVKGSLRANISVEGLGDTTYTKPA